jgi:CheY-like chemotaxis protein
MSIFPSKTRHILVLFERTSDIAQVKGILSNPFYAYYAANSIPSAFEILQRKQVDMVIAGVHLEYSDSYEFLNRMKADEQLRPIPFVFVSLRRSDVARCVDHGLSLAARALGAARYLSIDFNSRVEIQTEIENLFLPRATKSEAEEAREEESRPFWSTSPKKLPPTPGNNFSY